MIIPVLGDILKFLRSFITFVGSYKKVAEAHTKRYQIVRYITGYKVRSKYNEKTVMRYKHWQLLFQK